MGHRTRQLFFFSKQLHRIRNTKMKLSLLLDYLASGELGNLNLASNRLNIEPEKLPIVLRNLNRGLKDLHTKFLIRRAYTLIDTVVGEHVYVVSTEDFVEILFVYVNGRKLTEHEYKLLSTNTFQLNIFLGVTDDIRVEYKASHRELTDLDVSLDTDVNLPSSYVNALLYFVAARLYTSAVNQLDGDLNEGVTYERKYQEEIITLNNQGIDVEDMNTIDRFTSRGFA